MPFALTPKPVDEDDDPRLALVNRLVYYEKIRDVSQTIAALPRRNRDFVAANPGVEIPAPEKTKPKITPEKIAAAYPTTPRKRRRRKNPVQLQLQQKISKKTM